MLFSASPLITSSLFLEEKAYLTALQWHYLLMTISCGWCKSVECRLHLFRVVIASSHLSCPHLSPLWLGADSAAWLHICHHCACVSTDAGRKSATSYKHCVFLPYFV